MWYLAIGVLGVIGLILGFTGCFSGNSNNCSNNIQTSVNPSDSIKKPLTRQELQERMKTLAEKKVPNELATGAMCYKVAMPEDRAEYVCPVCGHKTLYESQTGLYLNRDLTSCRGLVKGLSQIGARLDESQFCKHCNPDFKDTPSLCLITKYSGEEEEHKVCGIDEEDLIVLQEFLSGKVVHRDDYDYESPLKDRMSQISNLLGIPEPKE